MERVPLYLFITPTTLGASVQAKPYLIVFQPKNDYYVSGYDADGLASAAAPVRSCLLAWPAELVHLTWRGLEGTLYEVRPVQDKYSNAQYKATRLQGYKMTRSKNY